jgi:uncharacterized cysteine cluster protein YcgN (CxxCxxCC family)
MGKRDNPFNSLTRRLRKSIGYVMSKNTTDKERFKRLGKIFKECARWNGQQVAGSEPSSCGPGCHECCYHMVYIRSRMEEKYISTKIGILPEQKKRVQGLFDKAWEKWEDLCTASGMKPEAPASPKDLDEPWIEMRVPCPLLHPETQMCSIYERRPFECRLRSAWKNPCFEPKQAGMIHPISPFHQSVIDLGHKIDEKHGWKHYQAIPLLEVIGKCLTK